MADRTILTGATGSDACHALFLTYHYPNPAQHGNTPLPHQAVFAGLQDLAQLGTPAKRSRKLSMSLCIQAQSFVLHLRWLPAWTRSSNSANPTQTPRPHIFCKLPRMQQGCSFPIATKDEGPPPSFPACTSKICCLGKCGGPSPAVA